MYRFYSATSGTHFYTNSIQERDMVRKTMPGWRYEGAVYAVYSTQVSGSQQVFRFYNTLTGAHFYTASEAERDHVKATDPNFHYEGPVYYLLP
jgi:hypothetical protein